MRTSVAGRPTVVVATAPFEPLARGAAAAYNLAAARVAVVRHPLGGVGPEEIEARASAAVEQVVTLLTAPP